MAHAASTLSPSRGTLIRLGGWISQAFFTVELAMQVRRERRALQDLDAAALKDLGLSGSQVNIETDRTFWDVPADRLRTW